MSSTQGYLRQRSIPNTLFKAPTNGCYYIFVAGAGNYVGNYPPGYMVFAEGHPFDISGINYIIRDMGKTIKAPILASGVLGTPGFFREFQFIDPVSVATPTSSTTFGVFGDAAQSFPPGNVGNTGYATFYVPIVVDGIVASGATLPNPYLAMGGQM